MKRSFFIFINLLFLFSLECFSQYVVFVPKGSNAIFDPAKINPSSLSEDMDIVEIKEENFLRVKVDSLNSVFPIDPFIVYQSTELLKLRIKYEKGSSCIDISKLVISITLLDKNNQNVGYKSCFASNDFIELFISVSKGSEISRIMVSVYESVNYSYIKNDYVYLSKIETEKDSDTILNSNFWAGGGFIRIISNTSWSISSDQSWLTVDKDKGIGTNTILFYYDENPYDKRSGKLTFCSPGNEDQIFTVFQGGGFFVIGEDIKLYGKEGSFGTFSISSLLSWNVSSDQSWLKVNPEKGDNSRQVMVIASENPGYSRYATVTISAEGIEDKTIIIIQEGWSDPVVVKKVILKWGCPEIDGFREESWDASSLNKIEKSFNRTENPTLNATWSAMCDYENLYLILEVIEKEHYPAWIAGGNDLDFDMPLIFFDWNDTLKDGLGPSTNFSGHYQFGEGFKEDSYFTPITKIPSQNGDKNPGGTYCYSYYEDYKYDEEIDDVKSINQKYVCELKIPFSNFFDKNGEQMNIDIAREKKEIGFDIILIDQDRELETPPQRAVWSSDQKDCYESMDFAGVLSFSNSNSGNGKNLSKDKIKVFPNPNKGRFSVDISRIKGVSLIKIFKMTGEIVYEESTNFKSMIDVDISHFSKGIYLVNISSEKGEFFEKVIIN